jgi:two-component system, NarL family, nitrate/nitrite response regulator NarL
MEGSVRNDEKSGDIGLVVAEGYPILLEGLEHVFRSEAGFHVLSSCGDGPAAVRAVSRHRPDILVLDLEIPGGALETLREMSGAQLPTRVVLYAGKVDVGVLVDAMRLGTKGIVLKSMTRHHLVQCVRKVHRGATWIERMSAQQAVGQFLRTGQGGGRAGMLSARQHDIVRMVLAGRSNKEIADKLAISEGTVKAHLHQIYEKLEVRGRLELALYARDRMIS